MTLPNDSAADVVDWTVADTSDAQASFSLTEFKEAGQYRAVSYV